MHTIVTFNQISSFVSAHIKYPDIFICFITLDNIEVFQVYRDIINVKFVCSYVLSSFIILPHIFLFEFKNVRENLRKPCCFSNENKMTVPSE